MLFPLTTRLGYPGGASLLSPTFFRRPRMARRTPAAPHPAVEALRPYLEGVAKKLADDLWGPDGPRWGTTLTELEDVALEARAIMAERLLQLGLQRQAAAATEQRPSELRHCPSCHRPFDGARPSAAANPSPSRDVQTRAGAVAWQEPQDFCTRCRRAFFPSEQESGD